MQEVLQQSADFADYAETVDDHQGCGLKGCKTVAGGRRPPERNQIIVSTLKGCKTLRSPKIWHPFRVRSDLLRYRRSALRFDLRLLSHNPTWLLLPSAPAVCLLTSLAQAMHSPSLRRPEWRRL